MKRAKSLKLLSVGNNIGYKKINSENNWNQSRKAKGHKS
jgi:hypothetical protein